MTAFERHVWQLEQLVSDARYTWVDHKNSSGRRKHQRHAAHREESLTKAHNTARVEMSPCLSFEKCWKFNRGLCFCGDMACYRTAATRSPVA